MGGLEVDFGGEAGLVRLNPPHRTEAPPIPGREAWEPIHRRRLSKVVSFLLRKSQKLRGDFSTDHMSAVIMRPSAAEAVTVEASHGGGAAELQGRAEDIE